jgi:hypothetical protein
MPFMRSESCSFIWHPNVVTWNDFMRCSSVVVRAVLLALLFALAGAAPAHATLFEISGRTDGAVPSPKHPRAATDVHMQAQLLTALPDGRLAAVTGWIDSLVGIDADGIATPLKGARHLVEDPADIVAAPGGGVLVSNEEVVQHVAADGKRTTRVARRCEASLCPTPWGLAPRPDGSLLVADTFNDRVLLAAPDGSVSTVLAEPLHWPFALGLTPDGGFVVAEGKPGHGRIDSGLRVWRVAPDGTPAVIAGGGTAPRPLACGGTAAGPRDLDLRHVVDAATGPNGTAYVADRTAGLFAVAPDGGLRVLACPAPALPTRIGDLRPSGLEFGQIRMHLRHLAVAPDGTLHIVDGAGRVFADLPDGAGRLAVALLDDRIRLTRAATVRVDGGRAVSLPAGVSEIDLPPTGRAVTTLRIVARSGDAVATTARRRLGRLTLAPGRKLLRRELRRASRFGAAPRLRGCRATARVVRCRRPKAVLRLRDDGELEVERAGRRWIAAV